MARLRSTAVVLLLSLLPVALAGDQPKAGKEESMAKSIYDFTVKDIDGKDVALSKYKGDVLLIVNVASL